MEKMEMSSKNIVTENIKKIRELFPNCVIETVENGQPVIRIDFDALKGELSEDITDELKERYQLNWPGKREAILLSNAPSTKTLRPSVEESTDFWNTQNLYIEGNNFEVLKVLRESYLKKIGVIYIDPPYNTGRNILYKNDFSIGKDKFALINNDVDEEGNIVKVNRKSEGRFHTKWLCEIYPVLRIARDLLNDEGVIFLAIDDNEYANLKKMCDEVFYEDNYVGTITTRSNPQGRGKKNIDPIHEYHLVYAKNISMLPELKILKEGFNGTEYWNFIRGGSNSRRYERPYRFYPMLVKGDKVFCIEKDEYKKIYDGTSFDEDFMKKLEEKYTKDGYRVVWPIATNGEEKVWQRKYDRAVEECSTYRYIGNQIKYPVQEYSTPKSMWYDDIHSNVQYGTGYLNKLFNGKDVFDFPKSVLTVRDLVSSVDAEYIMDFFAGSATTADAVMRLNAHDNGNRKFIMVQLPENLDENLQIVSDDEQQTILNAIELCDQMKKPHTIAEVAKERIRRAGNQIKTESGSENLDIGFRVLRLDSSNMNDIYYSPDQITTSLLFETVDNVKKDRCSLDLVFQIMLELGYPCCFDEQVSEEDIKKIAEMKPAFCVFKDSSFTDSLEINTIQIFKSVSPSTKVRVI